jgi:hypothetical protein
MLHVTTPQQKFGQGTYKALSGRRSDRYVFLLLADSLITFDSGNRLTTRPTSHCAQSLIEERIQRFADLVWVVTSFFFQQPHPR